MPTKSVYVSDQDLVDIQKHIDDLKQAKIDLQLALSAGLKIGYSIQDIDDQITSLELLIRTYKMR